MDAKPGMGSRELALAGTGIVIAANLEELKKCGEEIGVECKNRISCGSLYSTFYDLPVLLRKCSRVHGALEFPVAVEQLELAIECWPVLFEPLDVHLNVAETV